MLQLCNVKKTPRSKKWKEWKAQRRAVQKENKAAHSVQGCAVFPGAALCARSHCGAVLMQKHWPRVKQVIIIPRRPSFTSKAHHISSCTWNSGECWSEKWFLMNGKHRMPLTTPDALMNAEVSRCAILHGSNYTHILIVRQHLPGGSWRWSEKEQIPAWTNVHIHSHFRVHICCVLNVTLNGLCV